MWPRLRAAWDPPRGTTPLSVKNPPWPCQWACQSVPGEPLAVLGEPCRPHPPPKRFPLRSAPLLRPLSLAEGQSLPRTLHPLQGERQIPKPSPPRPFPSHRSLLSAHSSPSEGSSAHPPQLVEAASSSLSLVSMPRPGGGEGWGWFRDGWASVTAAKRGEVEHWHPSGPPLFTLSWGRGRFRRPRPPRLIRGRSPLSRPASALLSAQPSSPSEGSFPAPQYHHVVPTPIGRSRLFLPLT